MKHDRRHRIERFRAFLLRERAQTRPENVMTLSVLSGSSVLAFSHISDGATATAVTRVVRLFF
jgi:hypothetical protein